MPFGFALSRVYQILRDHLKLFLGIGVAPGVAMIVLYAAMFGIMFNSLRPLLTPSSDPLAAVNAQFTMMRIVLQLTLLWMIPMMVIGAFYLGAAFHAGNKIDSGVGTSVGECFGVAWTRMGQSIVLLLWIYFRAFGLVLAIMCVGFGLFALLTPGFPNQAPSPALFAVFPVLMLLYLAAYVYGIIVALRMSLAFPAWLEEGLTAGDAIRRSTYLTQGSKGRIFLLLLVVDLIGTACFMVLYMVGLVVFAIGALVMGVSQSHPSGPWVIAAVVVGGLVVACFFYVWTALLYGSFVVTLSVVYHDERRRKDAPIAAQLPMAGTELPPGAEPA
jgi:hypothetical protein